MFCCQGEKPVHILENYIHSIKASVERMPEEKYIPCILVSQHYF